MITVLNRKALLVTTDLARQARARIQLRKAGIAYKVSIARLGSDAPAGTLKATAVDYDHEYTIYVKSGELDRARQLLETGDAVQEVLEQGKPA